MLFFVGLLLGLSHYEIYRLTNAALDAREQRIRNEALQNLARSERILDESAALVIELCVRNGGHDCSLEVAPIAHTAEEFPVALWQRYASPVWFDINQTRTLNYREARHEDDVKHICPLQLDVIERAMELWSAKGDTVFSPFLGVGSEGYVAVKMGRKFIGSELKPSYFDQAVKNLHDAEISQQDLFAGQNS